jgi:hypothetical protein
MQIKQFSCPICGYKSTDSERIKRCEDMCNSMIDAFMRIRKITRKEALEQYLMEL